MIYSKKREAFTLVELIVVITILAILGTIAFMAFQGYSKDARDSVRISDIGNMETSLEIFQTTKGFYPEPTTGIAVTYSGSEVWIEGTVGDSVVTNLSQLSKKPIDPLTGTEYTYSRLNTGKEYEIGAIFEGDSIATSGILPQTYAAGEFQAYIKGTYNGVVAKVQSGSTTYVLAVPSIISSDLTDTDLMNILEQQKLVLKNHDNVPSSYSGLGYTSTGGVDYNSSTLNNILVYQGNILDLSDSSALKAFSDNLQTAYSGSSVSGGGIYAEVLDLDTNNENEVLFLVGNIVNNELGGNVSLSPKVNNAIKFSFPSGVYTDITTYNTKLLSDVVTFIYKDDLSGNYMLGTQGGLSYFDDSNTDWVGGDAISSIHPYNGAIAKDTLSGTLNIGTIYGNGLWVSDIAQNNWTKLTTTTTPAIPSNYVSSYLRDSNGNFWLGATTGGVYKSTDFVNWINVSNTSYYAVSSIRELDNGDIVISYWGNSLRVYDGSIGVNFFTGYNGSAYIFSTYKDDLGNFWVGSSSGISKYDGSTWTLYNDAVTGLPSLTNSVESIFKDSLGNMWFGTRGGLVKYDGSIWSLYTTTDGLPHNYVNDINETDNGNLLLGTDNGFSVFNGTIFTNYDSSTGLANNSITEFYQASDGKMLMSTYGGINIYDGTTWKAYYSGDLSHSQLKSIFKDSSGNIWVGSNAGLDKYDGDTWTLYTTVDGLANNQVLGAVEDSDGNIWFATRGGGVSKYDGSTWTTYNNTNGIISNYVDCILLDSNGDIWVGSGNQGGVSKFNGTTWDNMSVPSNSAYSLFEDSSGNIWAGTLGGASKYDGSTWTTYTTTDGLLSNTVYSIAEDNFGNILVGTVSGLNKYDGNTWSSYTIADGLIGDYIRDIYKDTSGNIWIGTTTGISVFGK